MPSQAWAQPLPKLADVIEGSVPCGHPALTVSNALVALDVDDDAVSPQLETVEGFIDHVSENRGVPPYHGRMEVEPAGPKADLFAAIREVGALCRPQASRIPRSTSGSPQFTALTAPTKKAAEQPAESPTIKAELL